VATVALLAIGLFWVDRHERQVEFAAAAACAVLVKAAVADTSERVGIMQQYISPALNTDTTAEVKAGLKQLVQPVAQAGIPRLDRAREDCGALRVSLWHGEAIQARDAVLDWLFTRRAWLAAVAVGDSGADDLVARANRLEGEARTALAATAPSAAAARDLRLRWDAPK
jgi:hypothetical protein